MCSALLLHTSRPHVRCSVRCKGLPTMNVRRESLITVIDAISTSEYSMCVACQLRATNDTRLMFRQTFMQVGVLQYCIHLKRPLLCSPPPRVLQRQRHPRTTTRVVLAYNSTLVAVPDVFGANPAGAPSVAMLSCSAHESARNGARLVTPKTGQHVWTTWVACAPVRTSPQLYIHNPSSNHDQL